MYVLADVEWVENDQGLISFTQIAMFRVDEKWKLVRCKSRRIRPKDSSFHQWDHMAFTGGTKDDFLSAPSYSQAFEDIQKWLWPGDTICWWSNESKDWIQKMVPTAKRKAEILCEASGVKLGNLVAIDYNWGELDIYSHTRFDCCEEAMAPMKACSIDIDPEDIDVSDTATFVWELV